MLVCCWRKKKEERRKRERSWRKEKMMENMGLGCWESKGKKDPLEQKPAQGWDGTLLWDPIACEKLQKLPLS